MGIENITTRAATSIKRVIQGLRFVKSEQEVKDEEFTARIAATEMNFKHWDSDVLKAECYDGLAKWGVENGASKELVDMMENLADEHRMKNEFASCKLRYDEQKARLAMADTILAGNAL